MNRDEIIEVLENYSHELSEEEYMILKREITNTTQ